MIVPVMAISNLVLTQQIYSEETNGAHAHYREPVPLKLHSFWYNQTRKEPKGYLKEARNKQSVRFLTDTLYIRM